MDRTLLVILGASFALLSVLVWRSPWSQDTGDHIVDGVPAPEALVKHGKEFDKPEIIQVTEGVYVAFGFALGNSILLEGPDGLVIVDTTESGEAGREIMQHFRNISSKPIKAIVYTHCHTDHFRGVLSFVEDQDHPPEIIAHELFLPTIRQQITTGRRFYIYAMYQFGIALSQDALINAGLGHVMKLNMGDMVHFLEPTIEVQGDGERLDIAGLHLEFIHIPGETPDQMAVWLPEKRVLLPGDDVYKAFPNLYAIRGTPPRDVQVWANSVHKMATLRPKYLVPSHTKPVSNEEEIYSILTTYGNAIQLVHDQTVRYINKNLHPQEIARKVKLPKKYASHSYLKEFYGNVEWSVKSVYTQYIGWFSGDPVDLFPLTSEETAGRMIALVGKGQLLQGAQEALGKGDYQWALELATHIYIMHPSDTDALSLRLEALRGLASQQSNANGRHFYLTAALEDHGRLDWSVNMSEVVEHMPISWLLNAMRTSLKAEEVEGVTMKVVMNFTDVEEVYLLTLQDSLLKVRPFKQEIQDKVDIIITTTEVTWKHLVLQKLSALSAYMSGSLSVDGSLWQLRKFMGWFERVPLKT